MRAGGPELLVGGTVEASFRRAARFGDGWTMGGGRPDDFAAASAPVRDAWRDAGREGEPRLVALCYFALGESARAAADGYLKDYYAYTGPYAEQIAQSAVVEEEMALQYRDAFAASGCDEFVYYPCSTDPGQVDLLADAVL